MFLERRNKTTKFMAQKGSPRRVLASSHWSWPRSAANGSDRLIRPGDWRRQPLRLLLRRRSRSESRVPFFLASRPAIVTREFDGRSLLRSLDARCSAVGLARGRAQKSRGHNLSCSASRPLSPRKYQQCCATTKASLQRFMGRKPSFPPTDY